MTNFSVDDELVNQYLAESREHLTTIEADLLTIEDNGATIDEQLVNRVFRAAHSIKGGAGFFDLSKILELAHKAENVLDMVRCRQIVPTSESVSILLLAFDKLREMLLNHRQSNDADISEFVAALTNLTTANLPFDQKRSLEDIVVLAVPDAARIIQITAFDLAQARRGGRSIYLIEYDLIHDIQRLGKTPLAVLKVLMAYGSILETAFDLESAGTLEDEPSNRLMLEVLYATPVEPELFPEILSVPLERVKLIEKNGIIKPLNDLVRAGLSDIGALAVAVNTVDATFVKDAPDGPARPVAQALLSAVTATTPHEPAGTADAIESTAKHGAATHDEKTIRLNVELLDSLMTLAGELVLSRNQLNEAVSNRDDQGIRAGTHRLSLVTSELQSAVALTRMQSVGALFSKFTRLVRDLGRDLGKQVQLKVEGGEVEIDKTILEGLGDPLTHMIRNSVDHGVELPAVRTAAGKPAMGTISLCARHQAGQVVIEITDDGKGLAGEKIAESSVAKGLVTREQVAAMSDRDKIALIFLPGVSTAEKVSSVSGRGVGMDVVKTNLDRLGGKVEIDSTPGQGTSFRIKLPLTLAIIPSLLVSDSGQRFAIPQVSVGELIRIAPSQLAERIDRAADAEVLLVRDRLVPLLHLDPARGATRRNCSDQALNVVLVDTGHFEYGLVVDELHDTVEIVVKPLGRHLQELSDYAGATILGDGHVAIILDVAGIAARAGLIAGAVSAAAALDGNDESAGDIHSLLLFHSGANEACAVPIEQVTRVERVRPERVELLGGRKTMQYGNASLPLVALSDIANVAQIDETQNWIVIVFECAGQPIGLLAAEPLDMIETKVALDATTLRQPGVAGSAILNARTTLIIDIFELAETVRRGGEPGTQRQLAAKTVSASETILIAEDSDFFRGQIQRMVEGAGYQVLAAADGQAAWELLDRHAAEVSMVATDVEMPRLDGLGLTRRIRSDIRFEKLPVIALSSLAGEEEIARALSAGVTEYQVKLDQDELLEGIRRALGHAALTLAR